MKLHLPSSLRKALLAVLASTTYFSTADAACLHAAVSPTTYTDFGQNMARYSVYQVNELLTQIRANNGVQIPYTTDTPPATMGVGQPMISFEGVNGDGAFTAVGYNYTATVAHNGCPNPCFTARYLGNNDGIQYQGVEYRSSQDKVFLLSPSIDYKITRSSKIYTDITASGVFDTTAYLRSGRQVTDLVHYRAGAGTCDQADFQGNTHNLAGGYSYITGGVVATLGFGYAGEYDYTQDYEPGQGPRDSRGVIDDPYTISIRGIQDYGPGGAGQPTPDNPKVYLLPFVSRGGDSGSPVWAWNDVTKAYELISCHQARGGDNSYSRGASEWTMGAMEYFNEHVDMDKAGHTVHMGAVVTQGDYKYDETNKVGTTLQYGSITSDAAQDFATVSFCGVGEKGGKTIYTWLSLYDQKDVQNWYHYGNTYFNANGNGKDMHLGDLFYTENIVFESASTSENRIVLDADIDMGIGYAQFSRAEGAPDGQNVVFRLESQRNVEENRDFFLSSAGYIVDKGVELHIGITNTQWDAAHNDYYYREWRKQGDGDMYIEGTGNNEVFLNLGGKGTTYLNETDGYAAYNVLINNGATLNFGTDTKQIARDVTFGNGGGYLEFSGLEEFTWESGSNSHVGDDGFTINALTQDATLINSEGDTTLHYVTPGATTFLGSFQDTADSSLTVIYEGGGTWTLNSIHTKLLNEGSSFIVQSGTAELVGQLTVHGIGSIGGKGGTRYTHPDDWHYSDAAMDVEVREGATFRLGSHARLTGDVNVQSGGTLEIAEGVKHQYEYIEGWLIAEDTYDPFYRDFYGLKGNVTLADNSTLRFKFSEGTDAQNVYTYNITGDGNVDMQLGRSGATLVLSGENTFTGTKTLSGGGLVAEHETSLGDTNANKWHVKEDAFIAVKEIDGNRALTHIDGDSTGVIALTQDQTEQVDLAEHTHMFVGALAGEKVEYGESPQTVGSRTVYTEEKLDTVTLDGSRYWQLGGGGGELVVNFLLDDADAQLMLGNEYTTGTVTLTNVWNRIGSIYFAGKVTLNYTSEEALGGSKIALDYTNRVAGSPSVVSLLTRHSSGAMMLDGMENDNVDLTDHAELFLGSQGLVEYNGTVTAGGGAYRFGGITGTLVLNKALTQEDDTPLNLIVDAQTYSGGTLALAQAAEITGSVTVMGHDAARAGFSGGDIALRTDVNNAIASATAVTLKDGGILDVNGTEQTLHGFNMEAGSLLTDSSANWDGVVTLQVNQGETSTLAGAVDVNHLVKNGDGILLLAGDNAYGNLEINGGLVRLQNGNSLSASGVTLVKEGGELDLAGDFDVTGSVAFAGGTAKVGGKAINGTLMVGTNGDGTPNEGLLLQEKSGTSTRINAAVEVAEGSTLTMKGENGTFVLTALDVNESGGTIAFEGKRLTLNRGGADPMTVGGTISIKGGASASNRTTLYSDGSSNNMTRDINQLHVDDGYVSISEASWNTIWNIHSLTGEGDLLWDSRTTHWFSAQLVLDGANEFEGQLTAKRNGGAADNRKYQAYLVIAHDQAAQYMDINATGSAANNFMSVGIDTEYAEMKSLSSDNQFAVLYAGSAVAGSENDVGTPLATEPVSTRQAYLVLTGDGTHEFKGNVVGQDVYVQMKTKDDGTQEKIGEVENTGLSLVMNGRGTQTFSGAKTRFNSVDVNNGHLVISSQELTITGDVSLAAGASLAIENELTFDDFCSFNIFSNGEVSASNRATFTGNLAFGEIGMLNVGAYAQLNGNLALNNSLMSISGAAMSHDAATLSISGCVSGDAVTIALMDTASLSTGSAYYLASGDWSSTEVTLDLSESPYLTATVTKNDIGNLYVTFQTTDGSFVWNGNEGAHSWDGSHFGQQTSVPGASNTAVFTDAAENRNVDIAASSHVGTMVIDSTKDYTFNSNGGVVTTDKLVKSGSGAAELSSAVVVGSGEDTEHMGTVEINDGELVVKSADTLAHIKMISGGGTLGISYDNASEETIFRAPNSAVGSLHIKDGSYTANVGLHYNDLILDANSTYTLGANKTIYGAVTVNGTNAEINLGNYTLSAGDVVLESDLSLKGSGGQLSANVSGADHTVSTSNNVTINNTTFNANLHVTSGNTHLAGGVYSEIGTITLDPSAIFTINSGAAVTNLVDISMGEGSRLNLENGNGGNTSLIANITMAGQTAEIDGSIYGNGTNVQGYITGKGVLTLGIYSGHQNAWRLDSEISDAAGGQLALAINSNVTLTAANTYTGGTTISGSTVQVTNEQALAGGSLDMTGGTLKLNSNLNLTQLTGTAGTLQLNGKRLTLTGNGGAVNSFAGTVSGTGSLVKTGSANQEFTQAVALTDLAVNGGTLQLGGGSASGKVTVAQGAELRINDNDFTISSAVENAGTFAFSGEAHKLVLDPSGAFEQESLGYRDITGGTESGNGFAQGTTIKVFNNLGDGTVTGVSKVSYLGDSLTLDTETGLATMGASTTVYTVRQGVVEYNDAFIGADRASDIEVFSLASASSSEPATLKLEKGLANGVTILSAGLGGNVEIAQGVELAQTQLNAQARTTLIGSGTYVLNQNGTALPGEVSLGKGAQWTGVVRISGQYTNMQQTINALDNAERTSSVELRGVSGWLGGNVDANIILSGSGENGTGTAVTITDGSSGATRVFSGTVSGHGDYYYNWNNGGTGQTHSFSGDVSGWDGSFIVGGNIKNATALEFSGKATRINADVLYQGGNTLTVRMLQQGAAEMNGDISHSSGSVNVVVGNSSSNTEAVFNGNLQNVNYLELISGSSATLAGDANVLGGLRINRDSTLFNSGHTTLGGDISNFGGFVVNRGTLDYGSLEGLDSVTNEQGANIIVNKALTFGSIENYGDITISSLMQGTVSGYVDALGNTESGNGFATTSLTVRGGEASIINHDGGRILYGGNDVTDEVLQHGTITAKVNHGTYFINSTDNNVSYSTIAAKASDALEYISFTNGTQLTVDDAGSSHLRTSQVKVVEGTATLNMQNGATLVVDATTSAKVAEASTGSTINLVLDSDSDTRMTLGALTVSGSTVNVDGSGVLSLGGGQYGIKTLNIRGGTVYSNRSDGTAFIGHNTVNIYGGGTLQLANTDNMGYGGSALASVILQGSADDAAALELGGRQTFSTALSLNGHSVVRAMSGATSTGQNAPMLDPFSSGSISVSGTDNLLAVPVRMRQAMTITVAADGELTFDGGVYDQNGHGSKLTKAGAGTLTLAGTGHLYTKSTVDISAGTLAVDTDASFCDLTSSAALHITSGTTALTAYKASNSSASITVDTGATLAFNGTAALNQAITNNGLVTFGSGCTAITLNGTFDHAESVYRDIAAGTVSADGNGLKSDGYVTVLNGGEVALSGAVTVNYDGKAYQLRSDGRAYLNSDAGTYYVRTGSVDYTDAVAAESSITTIALSNNATLNLQTRLADTVANGIRSTGGTVNIAEGVLLSSVSLHGESGTTLLSGEGTYAIDLAQSVTLGNNVSLGNSWDGTLRLSGTATQDVNLDSIASHDGTYAALELAGATANLAAGTVHADLNLDGAQALTVTNDGDFTFDGNISGSGNIVHSVAGASTYNLDAAKLADWDGAIVNGEGSLTVALTNSGSATSVNGSFIGIDRLFSTGDITVSTVQTNNSGTALTGTDGTLTVSNLIGEGNVTVSGKVSLGGDSYTGSSITVSDANGTLYLNNMNAAQAVLTNSGTVELTGTSAVLGGVEGNGTIQVQTGSSSTLEITGTGEHTSSASIKSGVDLVKSGVGTQTFGGDMRDFNGAVDVVSGKLALNNGAHISALTLSGGEIEFTGEGTTGLGNVRVVSGAEASIVATAGQIALQQAIMNAGALTLRGTIDVSALAMETRDNGYVSVADEQTADGSGFATVQSAVEVVRNVMAGSLVTQGVTVTRDGLTAELDSDGWARFDSGKTTNYDTYYLRDNKVQNLALSRIQQVAQDKGSTELAKIVVDNTAASVNLTVDNQVGIGLFRVDEDCTALLNITADGAITAPERFKGVSGAVVLSGEGEYRLSSMDTLGRGISLDQNGWNGTVVLTGQTSNLDLSSGSPLWLDREANCTGVGFDDWGGNLADAGWNTQARILIKEGGMRIEGAPLGAQTAIYTFENAVSGSGDITNARQGATEFVFEAESNWNGTFVAEAGDNDITYHIAAVNSSVNADGGNVSVSLAHDGESPIQVKGSFSHTGESGMNVFALTDTTFSGTADVTSLYVEEGATARIASQFTADSITSFGSLAVDNGGRFTLNGDIETLGSTIANSGTIAFAEGTTITLFENGTFTESESTYQDIGGEQSPTGNGFRISGGLMVINNNTQDASIVGYQNVTVQYAQGEYSMNEHGQLINEEDMHTYYIHNGSVTYSVLEEAANDMVAISLNNKKVPGSTPTLVLDKNLADSVTGGIISDGGTISIGPGATLQSSRLYVNGETDLVGSGTYELGATTDLRGVTLGNGWTGTVSVTDAQNVQDLDISTLSAAGSTVRLSGVTGSLAENTASAGTLELADSGSAPALKVTSAVSSKTYTVGGAITGTGSLEAAANATYKLSGDLSQWNGDFLASANDNGTTTVTFTGNPVVSNAINIGADIRNTSENTAHKLNVKVDETAVSVNLNGGLEGVNTLTYQANAAGHTLHIENLSTNDSGTSVQLQDGNYASTIEIANLHGSGTLTFNNLCKSDNLAHFVINGGNYEGEAIEFNAMRGGYSYGSRCVLFTLGNETVAEDSVIRSSIVNTGARVDVGISINATTVRVGGLADKDGNNLNNTRFNLVSGNPTNHTAVSDAGFTSDGTVRTLVITGQGGSTAAKVGANLNLTMDSAGNTQNFTGDMSLFNGDINVNAGTLGITPTAELSLHAVNVEEGANLVLRAATTTLAETIANAGSLTIGGTFVLDAMDISGSSTFEHGEAADNNGFLVGGPSIQVVQGMGTTMAEDGVTMSYKGELGTFDANTGLCTFQGQPGTHYETFYVNASGTAESLAHAEGASSGALSTVRLTDGTTLNMDLAGATLNTVEVSPAASATLHVAQSATLTTVSGLEKGQTLAIESDSAAVLTLGGASSVQGDLLITHSTVKMGNVQSLGAYNRITGIDATPLRSITVGEQGVLDVNGGETGSDVGYTVTLDGGTLTNTGGDKNYGKRQPVTNLILDSDSTVVAQKTFGLVASGHAATTLALNGHTLEKTGGNAFYIVNATVAVGDGGRIRVSEGMLNFNGTETGKRGAMEGTLELAGGNVAGHINLGGDTTFDATAASSDVTADIATNGHDVHFAGDGNISMHAHSNTGENGSGAISGSGTIVKEGAGTTAISGSLSGFNGSIDARGGVLELLNQNSLNVQDVTIADGATVSAYVGTNKLDEYEATLTISGTLAAKGADGKLNANVVMETDSTLDASATGGSGISLGSTLTIMEGGINLSKADFEAVAGLGYGDRYVLFNGVDSLTLDQAYTEAITPEMQINAADWFHGVEPEKYYVVYDGSNVGQVAIFCATPEPATSTLSLLALAALAARRRRR